MNRRVCVWIGSVLGFALAGFGTATPAIAQPVPGATPGATTTTPPFNASTAAAPLVAPLAALQAGTVTAGQQSSVIAPFIKAQLAGLQTAINPANPTPATNAIATARAALIAGCPRGASASYHSAYCTELATGVAPLLSAAGTPSAVKVNLGIVVERAAVNGGVAQIQPAVSQLLSDHADVAAYWGCKAARPLILTIVTQPGPAANNNKIYGDVVASVKAHPKGGMAGLIATEAYRALVVNPNNVAGIPAQNVWPMLKPLYTPVLDLLALRTAQYADGVIPAPDAEANAPTFLSKAGLGTAAQVARAEQELVTLVDFIGQRATLATPAELVELRATASNAAGALNVFTGLQALTPIVRMPPGVTGANMATLCSSAFPLASVPIPALKKPPTLPAIAPTTVPAAPANPAGAGGGPVARP